MSVPEKREPPGAPPMQSDTKGDYTEKDADTSLTNGDNPSSTTAQQHESLPYNWDKPETAVEHVGFKELFKRNWHPTVVYCGVFWSFGMCVAFLGPTLLDLGCQTSSDMSRISWVFFFQLCFTLIGSVIAGLLAQRSNANFVLLVACTLIPILMFTIPFCKELSALGIVLCLMGLNMGAIDCLANVQMIKLYGEAVSPFLQAMHFCYGFGAFVSPLIAEPFLLNEDCSDFIDDPSHRVRIEETPRHHNVTIDNLDEAQHSTEVRFSFWIMCAIQIPIPILVTSLLYREKINGLIISDESTRKVNGDTPKQAYGTMEKDKGGDKSSFLSPQQYRHHNRYKMCGTARSQLYAIVLFTAILLFLFDGLQGTFALGRLVSIPVATVVSSACMLGTNIMGSTFSMVLMLAMRHDHIALYFGTCFFGLFISSATPSALALAEQFIDINSSITTLLVVSAAMGDMVSPVIVANLFVHVGPWSFLQFGLAFCILAVFFYLLLLGVGSQTPKYQSKGASTSFIWCGLCCVRAMDANDDEPTTHVKYYTRMSESDSTMELGTVPNGATENGGTKHS